MANYTQWRIQADKGVVRRVTWVCGDQLVLVETVVDKIRAMVGAAEMDRVSLTAAEDEDTHIWDALHQYPLTPGAPRLIVVRQAQLIADWTPLHRWLAQTRRLPNVFVVFVAAEPDFPRADGELAAHVEAMKAPRGHLVRCAAPNPADAVDYIRAQVSISAEAARHLLARTGGDLTAATWACRKIAVFARPAGTSTVDALAEVGPAEEFVDSLLAGRKADALLHIPDLDPRALPGMFALLDTRLDLLGTLWRAAAAGQSSKDITGVPIFLVRAYYNIAGGYEPRRCARNRAVLAVLDDVVRGGAHDGVPEALVALW